MTIIAAADGSAIGNPGPAGWGWVVDENAWACGGWKRGTNNQGELTAVLDLLRQTAHVEEPLHILCDSQYVINSVTKWMAGWKRRGWTKRDGKPVLNVELMQALDRAMAGRDVTFEWVRGHTGHDLNERADRLATGASAAFAEGRGDSLDSGPGYPGARDSGAGTDPASPPPAGSGTPTDVPAPEADLFSFDDEPPTGDTGDEVWALEGDIRTAQAAGDGDGLEALLHPGFHGIDALGQRVSRDEFLRLRPRAEPDAVELIDAESLGADRELLIWRTTGRAGALHSSLWVRGARGWRLRFRQSTPVR